MIFKITKNNKIIKPKNYKTNKYGIIEKQVLRGTYNKDFKTCKENVKVFVTSNKLRLDMINAR